MQPRTGILAMLSATVFVVGAGAGQSAGDALLVRAAAGPDGAVSGDRFVLSEERTTFRRGADKQIIVVFEWDGRPGRHRLKGEWTHVESGVSSASQLDHDARQRRFGAYWVFPLSSATPTSAWTFQATVDGAPAGQIQFNVGDDGSAGVEAASNTARVLSQAELYQRLTASTAVLLRSRRRGPAEPVAALALRERRLITPLSAMDEITSANLGRQSGARENVLLAGVPAWRGYFRVSR